MFRIKRSHCREKPEHRNWRVAPIRCSYRKPAHSNEYLAQQKKKKKEAKEDDADIEKRYRIRGGNVKMEAETRVMGPQPRNT